MDPEMFRFFLPPLLLLAGGEGVLDWGEIGMPHFFPFERDGSIEMVFLQEVENLAGGHFAGSRQDIGVGVAGGGFEDAVFDVDVAGVGLEMFPAIGGGFAGESPGMVGVPDHGMGAAKEFEKLEEGRCGGESVMGFDEDFYLPAVFLFLVLPPVEDLNGLAVIFVGKRGAPSATTEDAKVRSADLLGQLGKGEEGGAAAFAVAHEFEGCTENAGGVASEGLADGGEATGLFGEIGGKVDPVFERAKFEAVDRELVSEGEDLGKGQFRATHRREAGEESAGGIMWRGHRHRG
jgi:hypothetical protein